MTARLSRKLKRLGKKYISLGRDGGKIREESSLYPVKRLKNIYVQIDERTSLTLT